MDKSVSAVLVAAGASRRMGFDKLTANLGGKTVLERSIEAFDSHPDITELILVAGENRAWVESLAKKCRKPVQVVQGGSTRAQSVRSGVLAAKGELLAIHDAARPFVSGQVITAALQAAARCGAAAPAVPVKDTIKLVKRQGQVLVDHTPLRENLMAVQTPQCFDRALYLECMKKVQSDTVTDDCSLVEQAGHAVELTPGDYENYKITTPEDLRGEKKMRIGHGYDVHQLVEGRKLIMGGVEIPFEKGLLGHSDADVLAHAVMDALLGAAALGDIGKHFPDTDPAYAGADSLQLMAHVARILKENGYRVENIDATILCQKPKLAPYIEQMRANMAEVLHIDISQLSVKATTEEHLGFTGQGLGIAVHAVALLQSEKIG